MRQAVWSLQQRLDDLAVEAGHVNHEVCEETGRVLDLRRAEKWVFDQVEAGRSLYALARSDEIVGHVVRENGHVTHAENLERLFYKWLNWRNEEAKLRGADGRRERYREARRRGAYAKVDRGEAALEALAESGVVPASSEVTLAAQRANFAVKLAARDDRANFGEGKREGQVINIGALHLAALETAGSRQLESDGPDLLESEVVDESE